MATGARAVGKSPEAFRTISEVAALLETPAHVLRFWESKFPQIKPVKRAGGRRYYRPDDIALLGGIKVLLHEQGMTIRGVQKLLRERGPRTVAGLSALPWEGLDESAAGEDLLGLGAEEPGGAMVLPDDEPPEEAPVIVGPWPGAGGAEPEAPRAAAEVPRAGVVETFVAGTLARLGEAGEGPVAGGDGLDRLRAALARADRERLRERSEELAPLVARLLALRQGDAGAAR